MADDVITQMVNDPDFGKLSPIEQRKALAAHDPIFSKAGDEDISKFVMAHQAAKAPIDQTAVETEGPFKGIPVAAKPSEDMPGRFGMHAQPDPESTLSALPGVGGAVGGALGGMPGAALGGAGGESAAQLIRTAATGKPAESPITDIAIQGGAQGALEGLGQVGGWAGGKLSPIASQSLARILRLSPKAYQFGREPAEEVLQQSLAKGNLKEMVEGIGKASKETTAKLGAALDKTPGTISVFDAGTEASHSIPNPAAADRFEQIILDSAGKLGLKNLGKLTPVEANALKQEVARQARFVEGDLRPSVSSAAKQFGGKIKDSLIKLNPDIEGLLQSSSELTEASKAGQHAVRMEQAGRSESGLSSIDIKKPSTFVRPFTDTITGARTIFRVANMLKDQVPLSTALRVAFNFVYPGSSNEDSTSESNH